MLDSLIGLYGQLGGMGTAITLLILLLFFGAIYANTFVRRKYISLSQELAGFCAGEYESFDSDLLQWMTDEYKGAALTGGSAVNTQSIIDTGLQAFLKPCMLAERFLKKANSLMITAGLFGTFVGLTYAVGNIGNIMSSTDANSLMSDTGANTLSLLVTSFKGMAVAFVTSLFGTGLSILYITILTLMSAASAKSMFVSQLEEFLDVKVLSEINENRLKDEKQALQDRSGKTADLMLEAVRAFQSTATGFSESLKCLNDFNGVLSSNAEGVKESAMLLSNSLGKTSETVYESSVNIYNCTAALQCAISEFQAGNKQLENMASLMSELKALIQDSKTDRQLFQKSIYEIPDRLLNYHEAAAATIDRKPVKA